MGRVNSPQMGQNAIMNLEQDGAWGAVTQSHTQECTHETLLCGAPNQPNPTNGQDK